MLNEWVFGKAEKGKSGWMDACYACYAMEKEKDKDKGKNKDKDKESRCDTDTQPSNQPTDQLTNCVG